MYGREKRPANTESNCVYTQKTLQPQRKSAGCETEEEHAETIRELIGTKIEIRTITTEDFKSIDGVN